jgi:hypothetical protein
MDRDRKEEAILFTPPSPHNWFNDKFFAFRKTSGFTSEGFPKTSINLR